MLFVLAVVAAAIAFAWPRFDGTDPVLSLPDEVAVGMDGTQVAIGWRDEDSGLRHVRAYLRVGPGGTAGAATGSGTTAGAQASTREIPLHEARYPGSALTGPISPVEAEAATVALGGEALALEDGTATLVVEARDWSWSDFGRGNHVVRETPVSIDTKPPRVSVESGLTYIRRGGAAVVAYRVGSDAERSGVRVADAWFPGLPAPNAGEGARIAVFAIPIETPAAPSVEVVAIDAFGNESSARFDVRIQERAVPEITIALSNAFMERVAKPLGEAAGIGEATPLATFQRVNTELRAKNEATIADAIGPPTAIQWSGAFEQMRNSKVTSEFAELRNYTLGSKQGQRVSRARHYGFDLASTARAPITAANAGTVIFAEDNGIYGTLVMVDHGLGITTLYGHLSSLEVAVGDQVVKGEVLGRSGATGLAGGDHLHFAVLVGRTYVDPVEWWDPKWVREHVEARLSDVESVPVS